MPRSNTIYFILEFYHVLECAKLEYNLKKVRVLLPDNLAGVLLKLTGAMGFEPPDLPDYIGTFSR